MSSRLKPYISGIIFVLALVVIDLTFIGTRVSLIDPHQPIQISSQGLATQNGSLVARLNTSDSLSLPLVNPKNSDSFTNVSTTITFEDLDAQNKINIKPISIQGANMFNANWQSSNELYVESDSLSPESYSSLELTSKRNDFFKPGIFQWIRLQVFSFSLIDGLILGFLLLAGTFYWIYKIHSKLKWRAVGLAKTAPENLTPIQLAILHHGSIRPLDFVAYLAYLAERGYLQIIHHETDDELVFLSTGKDVNLVRYEKRIFQMLFPEGEKVGRISEIFERFDQQLFSTEIGQIYVDLYDSLEQKGYFSENPRSLHIRYKTAAILTQLIALILIVLSSFSQVGIIAGVLPFGLILFVIGAIIYKFASQMIAFTPKGQEFIGRCADFVAYLSSPELLNREGVYTYVLYQLMPFALSTDCAESWLQRFEQHVGYVPEWFDSPTELAADPEQFVRLFHQSADRLATYLTLLKDPNVD